MYIANKPAKYGIKLVMACDVESKYMLNAMPFLGNGTTRASPGLTLGHHLAKTLVAPYTHFNRNVTTDNWFTFMELAKDLMDNCGMTIVSTSCSNKKYLRVEIVDVKNRSKRSSAFLYNGNIGVVCARQEKNVLLLSSMHHQSTLEENWKARDCNVLQQYKRRGSDVCPLFLRPENKKVAFVRVLRDVEHCCSEFLRDLMQ